MHDAVGAQVVIVDGSGVGTRGEDGSSCRSVAGKITGDATKLS